MQRVLSMPLTAELQKTLTMILAGGKGDRLQPLTRERAKPAVPFGGQYRIIDFTLSNCIHSGLRKIYLLTQYLSRSLEEHIRFGWNFLPRRLGQFIVARPPQQGISARWYWGTADAIYQNLDSIEEEHPDRVLILGGDHIYRMDYGRMLAEHLENRAALTIAAIPVPRSECARFGIFECAAGGRVIGFQEKPKAPREIPGRQGWALASMGVYLFDTQDLVRELKRDALDETSSHDFGKDVIPRMIPESRVFAHHFTDVGSQTEPYWRDIGTLDSFYEANLDLCSPLPKFNLYDASWPTYTLQHAEPPAKTVLSDAQHHRTEVVDSLLSPGVVVSDATVRRSVLSYRVRVEQDALVEDSILFAGVHVGKGARVRRAIIDKWTHVPPGFQIGHDRGQDEKLFTVSESGIVVVPRSYRFDEVPSAHMTT